MDFDYGRFYVLGEGFTRAAIRVQVVDEIPNLFALTRGESVPEHPVRFRWGRALPPQLTGVRPPRTNPIEVVMARTAGRTSIGEWAIVDSNHGPPPYQSGALTN